MTIIGLGLCVTHFQPWPTALGQYNRARSSDDGATATDDETYSTRMSAGSLMVVTLSPSDFN